MKQPARTQKWGAATWIAALFITAGVPASFASSVVDDENQNEFAQIAEEYKQAMNSYNIEPIIPRLADKLDIRMPLGIHIHKPEKFRQYMNAMGNLIGITQGGRYTIATPKTLVRYKKGTKNVFSAGTIDEEVQFVGKNPRKYVSRWLVHLQKRGGTWKIVGGVLEVDAADFSSEEIAQYRATVENALKSDSK